MRNVSTGKIMEKKNGVSTGKVASWYYRFERADFKPDGKRNIAYKAGFKNKKEAEAAGQKAYNIEYGIIQDPLESKFGKYGNMQFECYIKNHWWEANYKHWKPSTAEGYQKKLKNYLFPEFGNIVLGAIDSEMLQMFFDNLYLNTSKSTTSIDNLRALFSQIFKYAVANKHLLDNPMISVKKPNTRIETNVKKHKQKRDIMKFFTTYKKNGNIIETFNTIEDAARAINVYESNDLARGNFIFKSYDIVDENNISHGCSHEVILARAQEIISNNKRRMLLTILMMSPCIDSINRNVDTIIKRFELWGHKKDFKELSERMDKFLSTTLLVAEDWKETCSSDDLEKAENYITEIKKSKKELNAYINQFDYMILQV